MGPIPGNKDRRGTIPRSLTKVQNASVRTTLSVLPPCPIDKKPGVPEKGLYALSISSLPSLPKLLMGTFVDEEEKRPQEKWRGRVTVPGTPGHKTAMMSPYDYS